MKKHLHGVMLAVASCLCILPTPAQNPAADSKPDLLIFTNGHQLQGTLVRGVGETNRL